jgi:hypothetical protein
MTRLPEFTGSVRVSSGVALVMLAGEIDRRSRLARVRKALAGNTAAVGPAMLDPKEPIDELFARADAPSYATCKRR